MSIECATHEGPRTESVRRSRHCSPVSADRSTARSTDSLSRAPRVVTLRDAQTNAAASELRSAAARHQSASLNKSGLGRRPSLKPPSRATRRRPRERTRATGRLLEHPAEFAHRLHPIRSIEPEPVEDRSQVVRDCPAFAQTAMCRAYPLAGANSRASRPCCPHRRGHVPVRAR